MRPFGSFLWFCAVLVLALPAVAAKVKETPLHKEAKALWARANQGDAAAQFQLAEKLLQNRSPFVLGPDGLAKPFPNPTPNQNKQRAIELYQKAAAQKFPGAGLALAEIYRQWGEYRDAALAENWYRHELAIGTPAAAFRLGEFLYFSEKDKAHQESVTMLQQAAREGNAEAYRFLARKAAGRQTPAEIAEAVRYFDLGTAAGDELAAIWKQNLLNDVAKAERSKQEDAVIAARNIRLAEEAEVHAAEIAARSTAFLLTLPPGPVRDAVDEFQRDFQTNENKGDDKRPAVTAFARQIHEIGTKEGLQLDAQSRIITEALMPIVARNPSWTYGLINAIPGELYPRAWALADYPPRFLTQYQHGANFQKSLDVEAANKIAAGVAAPRALPIREIGQLVGDGIVIWVDGSGTHGLILALRELPMGKPNTLGRRPAFIDAATGFTDWYLPSLGEWQQVFAERRRIEAALAREKGAPLGNHGHYWTSTEATASGGSRGTLTTGNWCYNPINNNERVSDPYNTQAAVRAMRQF